MIRGPLSLLTLQLDSDEHALDAPQLKRLNEWLVHIGSKCDEKARAQGRGFLVDHFKARGEVYTGASGGNLTFTITPTSLGTVFKVSDAITGESIDLTDYDNW